MPPAPQCVVPCSPNVVNGQTVYSVRFADVEAEVVAVTDGVFVYDGPMWAGREDNLGTTVLLRQGGVEVVVISLPQQPIDLALCRSLGIDCGSKRYVCVKSTGHFRSGFEAIAVRAASCWLCPSFCACFTTLCFAS